MNPFRIVSSWHPFQRDRGQLAREVEEELRIHIAMRTQANLRQGMAPEDAHEAALRRFGDLASIKRECCEIRESKFTTPAGWKGMGLMALGVGLAFWGMRGEYHNLNSPWILLAAIFVMLSSLRIVRKGIPAGRPGEGISNCDASTAVRGRG